MSRKCPVCGEETLEGFRFCMNCGAQIVADVEAAVTKTADQVEEAVSEAAEKAEDVASEAADQVTEAAEEPLVTLNEPIVETEGPIADLNEPIIETPLPAVDLSEPIVTLTEPIVSVPEPDITTPKKAAPEESSEPVPAVTEPVPAAHTEPVLAVAEPAPAAPSQPVPVVPIPVPVPEPKPVPTAPTYGEGVYGGATVAVFTPNPEPAPQANPTQYGQPYEQQNPGYAQQNPGYAQQYQSPYAQQYNPYQTAYGGNPAAPVTKTKEKKHLGIGRRFLAFFLCIFLFLFCIVSIVIFGFRKALSTENLSEAVISNDTISKMNIGDLTQRKEDEGKTIAQYVLEQIPEEQKALYPELTEENLNELLNNKDVQKLINSTVGNFVDYFTGESDELMIDSDKIIKILQDNEETIEKYTGKQLKSEDYDAIRNQIEEFNEEEVSKMPDHSGKGFATGMKLLRFLFSDTVLYILYGVTGFFVLMVFLACGRFVDSSLLHIGITGAFAGGIVFGGIKLGGTLIEKIVENQISETYIELIRKILLSHFEKAGLFVLCIGVGVMILGVVWKVIRFSMSD